MYYRQIRKLCSAAREVFMQNYPATKLDMSYSSHFLVCVLVTCKYECILFCSKMELF